MTANDSYLDSFLTDVARGARWVEFLDRDNFPLYYRWKDCQNDAARGEPIAVEQWNEFLMFEAFKRMTR